MHPITFCGHLVWYPLPYGWAECIVYTYHIGQPVVGYPRVQQTVQAIYPIIFCGHLVWYPCTTWQAALTLSPYIQWAECVLYTYHLASQGAGIPVYNGQPYPPILFHMVGGEDTLPHIVQVSP